MRRWKLEDLPPAVQAQVRKQLAVEDLRRNAPNLAQEAGSGPKGTNPRTGTGQRHTRGVVAPTRQPNKTEAEYNRIYLKGLGRYEAVSLRLPGGSRYTPDWMSIDEAGQIWLHEVKGSYRHHSHGRALTAWREAVAAFPCFRFVWATRGKGGAWEVCNA